MIKEEVLKQIENELLSSTEYFSRTKLYEVLNRELTRMGYWKNKSRGNPQKGWKNSKIAQRQVEIKKMMKEE